jgi:hypothetical protein
MRRRGRDGFDRTRPVKLASKPYAGRATKIDDVIGRRAKLGKRVEQRSEYIGRRRAPSRSSEESELQRGTWDAPAILRSERIRRHEGFSEARLNNIERWTGNLLVWLVDGLACFSWSCKQVVYQLGRLNACYRSPAMEILFATTELAPQVKVGGLADVSAALTKALRALGHSVTLLAPRYPQFERSGLLVARRLTPLSFTLGTQRYDVTLYDGRLPSQVELVLVDVPGLYDRGGVYGDETSDSAEHAVRFAVLSRTASELAEQRAAAGKPFDIVHCNDWPTALIPLYLAEQKKNCPELAHTHTVLTLHNVAHQGVFPKETLPSLGLGWDHFSVDSMEFYGAINVLKGGILAADALTTVSPTYARELLTSAGGEKLDGVLRSRASVLTGITNGIDTSVWSPSTDPSLPASPAFA